ncbi:Exostoses (Multiple)-like 3 [Rhizophlyctis rosea]|nr:Exostoses (Multiple)-like 3 [Rhizophlyctis rosea]
MDRASHHHHQQYTHKRTSSVPKTAHLPYYYTSPSDSPPIFPRDTKRKVRYTNNKGKAGDKVTTAGKTVLAVVTCVVVFAVWAGWGAGYCYDNANAGEDRRARDVAPEREVIGNVEWVVEPKGVQDVRDESVGFETKNPAVPAVEGIGGDAKEESKALTAIQEKPESFAYVTLLCDDIMLESTLVLAHSVKLSGSPHPFIVLILSTVSEEAQAKLSTPGVGVDDVRLVPELEYPYPDEINDAKRAMNKMCRYSKLHLWDMEFTKIVYLDADVLIVKNVDDLFEWPEFSAALDMGGTYNTGVFVAEPKKDTYSAMLQSYLTAPSYNRGDQGFLNWFFNHPGGSHPQILPPAYNTPIKAKEYAIWPMQRAAARILHFTSETKPWTFWFTPHPHWDRNFDAGLFHQWVRVHRAVERVLSDAQSNTTTTPTESYPLLSRAPVICENFLNYTSRFPNTTHYSVLIGTWDRIPYLLKAISHYRASPNVHTIFVTWHNPDAEIPPELQTLQDESEQNTIDPTYPPVVFLKQRTNTLNNRFNPIKRLRTRSVLIADEDVRVPLEDLDFAFGVHTQHPNQLVGFFPRGHRIVPGTEENETPEYEYVLRKETHTPGYSIMLTKSMFAPSDFLFTYTCLLPPQIHAYVDSLRNCEDIAFNMLVSGLTGLPPIAVNSTVDDFGTTSGISFQGGHLDVRSECMNGLVGHWGGKMVLRGNEVQVYRYSRVKYRKVRFEEWV